MYIIITVSAVVTAWTTLVTIPDGYRPRDEFNFTGGVLRQNGTLALSTNTLAGGVYSTMVTYVIPNP